MKCTLTGKPVSLYWEKDGHNLPITCKNKYVGGTVETPSLTIVSVDRQDDGTYTCYTQNDYMHCNASTKLSVKCGKFKCKVLFLFGLLCSTFRFFLSTIITMCMLTYIKEIYGLNYIRVFTNNLICLGIPSVLHFLFFMKINLPGFKVMVKLHI